MNALLLCLSLLAADKETTVTLRGIVKDAAGQPVAGAMVLASDHPERTDSSRLG